MIDNEINQLFGYLTKDQTVTSQSLRTLLQKLFTEQQIPKTNNQKFTKQSLVSVYKTAIDQGNVQQRLFHLFYYLDQGKKGYLNEVDIQRLFTVFGKEVSVTDVQSSFRYSKLPHNRLSFEDFKDHFYKF